MTLKNNKASLLSNIKLCASFHHRMWIQTEVMVRKGLSWFLTSVTLTFDLWPWPFAWTSLLSLVITPENFMMIRRREHSEKGVTDGRTEWTIHRAAWSQLKIYMGQKQVSYVLWNISWQMLPGCLFALNIYQTYFHYQGQNWSLSIQYYEFEGVADTMRTDDEHPFKHLM